MKKLFTILVALFITTTIWAQSPQKMTYQAVVRNSTDVLITNTLVGMQISILQGSTSGSSVYVETQTPTTNANGLVTIEIGGGTVISGDFSTINWSNGPYFIKTETDLTGGTSYTITGTSQLLSVPYALHAKTAESLSTPVSETDPIFIASPANGIISGDIVNWNDAFGWGNHASAGYLTSFTELDPLWTASPSFGIAAGDITNWNDAFGWGNHASAGYLTSFTETDPLWSASPSFGITGTNISDWNTAFGWGNHASAGYLTSFTETDPLWSASPSFGITGTNIADWSTAYGWGNHASAGYLTSFTETDPIFGASPANGITGANITNWNTAFGWGNHASAGYLTSFTETDPIWTAASTNYYTISQLVTSGLSAVNWANIITRPTTLAGYGITDAMSTSHAANAITAGNITNWNTAFGWGNHALAGYLTAEVDGIIGNEVTNVTNGTLTRSGAGTTISPYTLGLNLANANIWTASQTFTTPIISTLATGTAPLTVASTTVNTNLNADLHDGYHAGNAAGNVPVSNGTLNTTLNADLLDGVHAASLYNSAVAFNTTTNTLSVTDGAGTLSAVTNNSNPFLARHTGAGTLTSGTPINIFQVELYDYANQYNPATGVFTAAVTGVYFFQFTISMVKPAGTQNIAFAINGASQHYMWKETTSVPEDCAINGTVTYNLTAGQTVTLINTGLNGACNWFGEISGYRIR